MKWDPYKHPLSYRFVLCWGYLFSLDHVCGYPHALLKGQCVYGLYSFGGAEKVRPLHTPYLKSGSQDEVRPLQAPLIISLCALLGWSSLIRLYLWVSICAPKGSVCLWFVQFWRCRTSETTAHTLLEIWVTGWSETTTSTPHHITLCFIGGWSSLIRLYLWVSIWAPKGSVCLWFVQFCLDRTSDSIAGILLENQVTDWSETTRSIPYHITVCFVVWCFLIRPSLWVPIWAPNGSVCLWFVQFWRGRTSETTAHTLLEIWVTGWSETTTSTPYHITLCFVGGDLFSLDYICGYQYELLRGQFVCGF